MDVETGVVSGLEDKLVGGEAEKGMGNVRLFGVRPKWRHDWRKMSEREHGRY